MFVHYKWVQCKYARGKTISAYCIGCSRLQHWQRTYRDVLCFLLRENILCVSVHECTSASQGHSFAVFPELELSVSIHTLGMREYSERQTPIRAVAPPVHLDKQTWPFIISLAIPLLAAEGLLSSLCTGGKFSYFKPKICVLSTE